MMCYSVMTQAYSEKEIPSSPNRSGTYDLLITSLEALPLSYRRLVGAKAVKLGSPYMYSTSPKCVLKCMYRYTYVVISINVFLLKKVYILPHMYTM